MADRSPLIEVIQECQANALTQDPFLAVIFDDAGFYLRELREACLYLVGYDVAGWEGHMSAKEVLNRVGVSRFDESPAIGGKAE